MHVLKRVTIDYNSLARSILASGGMNDISAAHELQKSIITTNENITQRTGQLMCMDKIANMLGAKLADASFYIGSWRTLCTDKLAIQF